MLLKNADLQSDSAKTFLDRRRRASSLGKLGGRIPMLLVAYEEVALTFLLNYGRLVRYQVYMCKVPSSKICSRLLLINLEIQGLLSLTLPLLWTFSRLNNNLLSTPKSPPSPASCLPA